MLCPVMFTPEGMRFFGWGNGREGYGPWVS